MTITEDLVPLLDAIVPADAYPSASGNGGLEFIRRVLTVDHPDWAPRIRALRDRVLTAGGELDATVVAGFASDPEWRWLCDLVNHGYYADPGNGGNDAAASWRMLGWSPDPPTGWQTLAEDTQARDRSITPADLVERYDAIVVGSGAGGGTAACMLAEAGRRVLVVERGDFPSIDTLAVDHLRTPRTFAGFDPSTGPVSAGNPRVVDLCGQGRLLAPPDPAWGNNAMTVGGGTRVYGAQAWRLCPEDFAMATTYGIPDGSALADWPIDYAEMEPYYSRAEWEIGVSGAVAGDRSGAWRSRDYPMPPVPTTRPASLLADAAQRLAWNTLPVPLLINSTEFQGRSACALCSQCVGFACRVDAKNGSLNTVLARALTTGRAHLLTRTRAERVLTDSSGRVTGVALVGRAGGRVWRCEVLAGEVVVSAGAIESARLLLASAHDREPHGIGNNTDQVGRHLQDHPYAGALGVFADPVNDGVGPGPAVATNDFRHHNDGIVGGGMVANEFVPTPVSTYDYLTGAGLIPRFGAEAKQGMRRLLPRMQRVVGPIQSVTTAESRVRLDPRVRDEFGVPVAHLSGSPHPEDLRTHAFMTQRAVEWLSTAGAVDVRPQRALGADAGPSGGQHQAGTCRMGTDPAHSVTDPYARVWGHDNLRVVDGSLHVTNGGVNPVLTIFANAMRVMDHMVSDPPVG